MKNIYRISIFALCLLMALESNSQDEKGKFSFGLSTTSMLGIHNPDRPSAVYDKNVDFGIVADVYLQISERIQVRAAAGLRGVAAEGNEKYLVINFDPQTGGTKVILTCVDFLTSTNYLSVPVGVKIGLSKKWFASIGLENNFKIETSGSWTALDCNQEHEGLIQIPDRYTGVEYLPVLYSGVGFAPGIGDKWNLIIEPYFGIGLERSLEQVTNGVAPSLITNARLVNLGLRLGLIINK